MIKYIIKSQRLGLRNWHTNDLESFLKMSQDEEVMKYFPKLLSKDNCNDFINRMQVHYKEFGFCYFAIDILETGEFIGFTGMLNQTYKSNFTPCVDIGWRLKKSAWNKGYATEAAKVCLEFAQKYLELKEIYSIASKTNINSIAVMKKIGMKYNSTFHHPALKNYNHLKDCRVYNLHL